MVEFSTKSDMVCKLLDRLREDKLHALGFPILTEEDVKLSTMIGVKPRFSPLLPPHAIQVQ
jgi:hypothetical protein